MPIQGLSTERENWLHPLVPVYLPHISTPGRGELPSVFSVPSTLNNLTNEYLVVMAESPSNVKEGYKMSISEDLGTGNFDQSQEQPVMSGENPLKSLLGIVNHVRLLVLLLQHPSHCACCLLSLEGYSFVLGISVLIYAFLLQY